jgi:hypothetical protein
MMKLLLCVLAYFLGSDINYIYFLLEFKQNVEFIYLFSVYLRTISKARIK